jgi:hypothetical protein
MCSFIREHPRFEIPHTGCREQPSLAEYINQNEKDIRDLASKVTNKAFGIKFKATPAGYSIDNMWVLKDSLWPYNWDINDREELKILVPEPTVSDKATSWLNKTNKFIAHAPPIGAYVNNKKKIVVHVPVLEADSILKCGNTLERFPA